MFFSDFQKMTKGEECGNGMSDGKTGSQLQTVFFVQNILKLVILNLPLNSE